MTSDLVQPTALHQGLSSPEATARLARDGGNVLPRRPATPLWRRVVTQLRDPLVLVLLAAAVFTIATRDFTDAGVILFVIVVNATVGVVQEVKAERAITALSELTAPDARVVRDEAQRQVPAADLVVGDLLVLAEGDIVPADARIVQAAALLVDEAAVTGESVPVGKHRPTGSQRPDAADALDAVVSAGTVVVHGRGRAVVTATGAASATGRIAAMLVTESGLTPLQRRLAGVGRILAGVALVLCTVVLALGLVRGQPLDLMIVTAISLVVAAVPESLPAVVTLSLALGARRMTARHALIRRLPAVETLGSVTILATDKTGTLTEGTMVVRRLWTPTGEATVTGAGYSPAGDVTRDGRTVSGAEAPDLMALLTAVALCNDAALRPPDGDTTTWLPVGDPTEVALLTAAGKLGIDRTVLQQDLPRQAEVPFDSDRKRMTTAHRLGSGATRVICKGAPEALLQSPLLADDADLLHRAAARADELAGAGFRVLAVARADRASRPDLTREGERGLHLLGLVAIFDPPRATAATTISACTRAGIALVLITGDHPATAAAIAADLGIIAAGDPVHDCRAGDPGPPAALGTRVFARATPQQKVTIIEALRGTGAVVAMTGDGVNDGPALHAADIGVAMGQRGTEVARQAADLVLADDELSTVVAAAEEGRRVYANIRRFLLYALAGGTAEILVMLTGPFLGLALPLLPAQLLWINLLTHGLPGLALGSEPGDPSAMRQPPRPPAETVLGAGLWQRIARVGAVIAAVTLGTGVWADATDRPWQTLVFLALGGTQLAVALGSRARPGTRTNPMLFAAVGSALVLQLAAVYVPPLRELLHTQPVGGADLLLVGAAASLGYAAVRLDRLVGRGAPAAQSPGEIPLTKSR
ncbi:cation-transporting P-type ATPase [Dactylosporangium roseum]|uniref:Cation-transporting P-type ATPase n=1 Tax=Dactylosporangium roseum TaxID=47989 RepID=A0ABY5ZDB2_9ACTN|nr:cation-transporting P-type ATPase [Dactylosporangium roseum]UWZ39664.1 cation-transporting P-type ATPase [Dactylosporangium roseum]